MSRSTLHKRRDQALGAGAEYFYDNPLEIVRGEGAYLYDAAGRRYIDLYNNVPCVGHGNPVVAKAMFEQQSTLNVHNRYLHDGIVSFAERLVGLHDNDIESVVFSCTGTEANDVALTMARAVTGQRGVVCTGSAYHGSAGPSGALTYVGDDPVAGRDICGFPFPDVYRPLVEGLSEQALASVYLDRAAAAIQHLKKDGAGFAALIVCPIFANEGLPTVPPGLMPALQALVHQEGGLLIADEVQSGYGRTGAWWAYELMGLSPDIVVTGKPMGNGLPLAATAARREHVETFRSATGYFNTFASSPLQAAVGMAVLDEIERMDLVNAAADMGNTLLDALKPYQQTHPYVGDVRGTGLFISIEMVKYKNSREPDKALANRAANRLKDAGCLLSAAGAGDNVLKIRPPLVFTTEHADVFLDAFATCMDEIASC